MLEKTKKVLKEKSKNQLPPTGPVPDLAKDAVEVAKALKEDIKDIFEDVTLEGPICK